MATKLFLRSLADNAIGAFKDCITTAGSASTTGVVDTAASGTEIQWTQTAGGTVLEFISGRVPSGGFTLSGTMTFSIWAHESNMNANCGARSRVFKRTGAGVESEVGGGPYSDGVEFGTSAAEMVWTGAPTSTAFAENDRIIVRYYITNVGTMGGNFTCTITYNAADAATGDSFFQIFENVTFKAEEPPAQDLTPALFSNAHTFHAATVLATYALTPDLFTNSQTFHAPTVAQVTSLTADLFSNSQIFHGPTVSPGAAALTPNLFTNAQSFHAPTLAASYGLTPDLYTNDQIFYAPTVAGVAGEQSLSPPLLTNANTFHAATVAASYALRPALFSNSQAFYGPTISVAQGLRPSLFTNASAFYRPGIARSWGDDDLEPIVPTWVPIPPTVGDWP